MGITAELDNFIGASEFADTPSGLINDTCGERAFTVFQHCKRGTVLSGDEIAMVRDDMRAKGYRVEGGTVMSDLCAYFGRANASGGQLEIVYANAYGSSWDEIHQTLLDHAGRDGVVLEVELAYNLTGNEPKVKRHYVAVGAIHPVKGYLIANGDDIMALRSAPAPYGHGRVIPTRWMDKTVLAAARPSAAAVVRGLSYVEDLSAGALAAITALRINKRGLIVDADPEAGGGTQPDEPPDEPPSDAGELGEAGENGDSTATLV
jgi:hypothetical protein